MKAAVRALPTRRPPCRLFFGGRTPAVSGVWCFASPINALYVSTCCIFPPVFFGGRTPAGVWCSAGGVNAVYVSTCCCICVLTLLCQCPHTAVCVSSYCYICVLILLQIQVRVELPLTNSHSEFARAIHM